MPADTGDHQQCRLCGREAAVCTLSPSFCRFYARRRPMPFVVRAVCESTGELFVEPFPTLEEAEENARGWPYGYSVTLREEVV